jgi:hypothetical protein
LECFPSGLISINCSKFFFNFARYISSMTKTHNNCFSFRTFSAVFVLCCLVSVSLFAQNRALVKGRVTDDKNKGLELVNVGILNTTTGTVCDEKGFYNLPVPSGETLTVVFSRVGFETYKTDIQLSVGEIKIINISLKPQVTTFKPVEIVEERLSKDGMQKIDIKVVNFVPSTGGIEKLVLLTAPGVFSTSELSSTYSVRGGNYDENLVYVNDIEIYRPFLIRSGQQEGLSFLNSDLAGSVLFSSGGFDASYGDKTASVLDVQYRRPEKFGGTFSGGLLGANLHLEGISKDSAFTFLTGVRYKTSKYLLSSLETKGDYRPNFFDAQTYLSYQFNRKNSLSWLGYISTNTYNLIPQTRETSYGTINEAYRLTVYFSGKEVDRFNLYKNALIFTHKPNEKTQLKLITTAFVSNEEETFDILGEYWIGKLETDFGKPGFGEVSENRGVGAFLNHSRNYLTATVLNLEHRGKHFSDRWTLQWGAKVQREQIQDKINEWTYIDSSGYSLPHVSDSVGYTNPGMQPYQFLYIFDTLRSTIELNSLRYSGFFMARRELSLNDNIMIVTAGIRANFWDLNQQLLISPRASVSYRPKKHKHITYRFATGLYHQPPFYRELRNTDGTINTTIRAQQSIHFVAGTDVDLMLWRRPFKFTSELYYKYLDNLIPYIVDNVRIRYLPDLKSQGYATGIDLKINGEFVPDVESWINFSIMQTREDIKGDSYFVYFNSDGEKIVPGFTFNDIAVDSSLFFPGFIPRPTDQRVNFSLFFQDYLPNNSTFKMHLGIFFGSGLPFGVPNTEKYKHTLRMPAYRRVDVGFSKQLISEGGYKAKGFERIQNAYISVEVFNLLQINNTISYIWIQDVTGRRYAVPNYLTPRQLNIKLLVQF